MVYSVPVRVLINERFNNRLLPRRSNHQEMSNIRGTSLCSFRHFRFLLLEIELVIGHQSPSFYNIARGWFLCGLPLRRWTCGSLGCVPKKIMKGTDAGSHRNFTKVLHPAYKTMPLTVFRRSISFADCFPHSVLSYEDLGYFTPIRNNSFCIAVL